MHSGFETALGILFGIVWAVYRNRTGKWIPTPEDVESLIDRRFRTRAAKAGLIVAMYLVFHLLSNGNPVLRDMDEFAFWLCVLMVCFAVIDPWIDRPLRRLGIRK